MIAISALLGFGKATAQESAQKPDSINHNNKTKTVGNIPILAEEKFYSSDSVYILNFLNFPSNEQIMGFIQNRDDIKIQEHEFEHYEDLSKRLDDSNKRLTYASYNPAKDNITINLIKVIGSGIVAPRGGDSRINMGEQIYSKTTFRNSAQHFNNGVPGMLQHELWHQRNYHKISLYGLSLNQIIDIQIHDEFSAVISEILFRRRIYLQTKSIKDAFRGVETNSLRSNFSGRSPFHDYEKFLKKNKDTLTNKISPMEANLIIKIAIENFTDYADTYAINIPNLIGYKCSRLYRIYCGADKANQHFDGFDSAVQKIYSFDDLCILDHCDEAGREMINKAVQKFTSRKDFVKNLSNFRIGYEQAIDSHAQKFTQRQTFIFQTQDNER